MTALLQSTLTTSEAIAAFHEAERQVARARQMAGLTIQIRRCALDLSGAQLARLAGVDPSDLNRLERGAARWAMSLAVKVDEALSAIEHERRVRLHVAVAS
jgi:predicted transcriptional regulator